jgi:hypothetical protein
VVLHCSKQEVLTPDGQLKPFLKMALDDIKRITLTDVTIIGNQDEMAQGTSNQKGGKENLSMESLSDSLLIEISGSDSRGMDLATLKVLTLLDRMVSLGTLSKGCKETDQSRLLVGTVRRGPRDPSAVFQRADGQATRVAERHCRDAQCQLLRAVAFHDSVRQIAPTASAANHAVE